MITMISHLFLQHYWWIIISLLAGLLVFMMFVQGGQSVIFSLPGNELQKTMIINAMGRKWEITFTTLVTFGGAFFASFPLFYATSFGGAYWVWMAILFSFTIQAIAYEYRSKPGNIYGKKSFEILLLINGSLGPFLIGTAVATFFTGSQFTIDYMYQVRWGSSWHGLEALINGRNLSLGLAVLFLVRSNGLLYIINSIDDDDLRHNAVRKLPVNALSFLVFFMFFVVTLLLSDGFAADYTTGAVKMEAYKYLHNFLDMPVVMVLFITGAAGVVYGIGRTLFKGSGKGIWYSGPGTILVVFSLFIIAGFNNTSFYPSTQNLISSLTIRNASSSRFTLLTMMYVSFFIPVVFGYIWFVWKSLTKRKITEGEVKSGEHFY